MPSVPPRGIGGRELVRGLVPSRSLRGKGEWRALQAWKTSIFAAHTSGWERRAGGLRFPWRHSPIPRDSTVWAPKMAASEGQRPFCSGWGLRGRGEGVEVGMKEERGQRVAEARETGHS